MEKEKTPDRENPGLFRDAFVIDPTSPSGLRWKHASGNGRRVSGEMAGGLNYQGYWTVGLNNSEFQAHRVVWVMSNGPIPTGMQIDHIDGDRGNNHPDNLQLLTTGQNSRARNRINRTNGNGFIGVSKIHGQTQWMARVHREGKLRYLGCFDNPVSAAHAYNKAVIQWSKDHGETPRYLNPV